MKVSIVHSHRMTREILKRALATKLEAEVTDFSSIEDVLGSSMDYDAFVVYSDFGHKTGGAQGVAAIRRDKPDAYIIGVSYKPGADRKFGPVGADAFVVRAGNEIEELTKLIQKRAKARGGMPASTGA